MCTLRSICCPCGALLRHISLVLSEPLPEDIRLFREMDVVLDEIRRCYIDLDKFWVDEVQGVTKSLKNRLVNPEDIDRWRSFLESLEHTIVHWHLEVWVS